MEPAGAAGPYVTRLRVALATIRRMARFDMVQSRSTGSANT